MLAEHSLEHHMAGWVAALSIIPWGKVIDAAPQIATTASALWAGISREKPAEIAATDSVAVRLEKAEADLTMIHNQVLAASGVIAKLAEQNASLHKQCRILLVVSLVSLVVALTSFVALMWGAY